MWVHAAIAAVLVVQPAAASDVGDAKRLYTIGEQHMAAGRPAQAVALWRKVVAKLPRTAEYDGLRHKLLLRLGYGMLAAHAQTKRRQYLVDAAAILEAYLKDHEARFGAGEDAKAARGDVYQQLYEIESRLEAAPVEDPPADEPPAREAVAADPDDGEEADVVREVHVDTHARERPSVDDPKVRALLNSSVTTPEAGLVLTAPGVELLTPARGLVRLAGLARPSGVVSGRRARRAARSLGRTAALSVRPLLRACYEDAFARTPTDLVQTQVELTIGRDGTVRRAEVIGPDVVDAAGTACVTQRLAAAKAEADDDLHRLHRAIRVRVPLLFFWEDAKLVDEGNFCTGVGVQVSMCGKPRAQNHGSMGSMPAIDTPVRAPGR